MIAREAARAREASEAPHSGEAGRNSPRHQRGQRRKPGTRAKSSAPRPHLCFFLLSVGLIPLGQADLPLRHTRRFERIQGTQMQWGWPRGKSVVGGGGEAGASRRSTAPRRWRPRQHGSSISRRQCRPPAGAYDAVSMLNYRGAYLSAEEHHKVDLREEAAMRGKERREWGEGVCKARVSASFPARVGSEPPTPQIARGGDSERGEHSGPPRMRRAPFCLPAGCPPQILL